MLSDELEMEVEDIDDDDDIDPKTYSIEQVSDPEQDEDYEHLFKAENF